VVVPAVGVSPAAADGAKGLNLTRAVDSPACVPFNQNSELLIRMKQLLQLNQQKDRDATAG
jgi:hypothetical protein